MEKSYRRFNELRIKSKNCLNGFGNLENKLQNAIIELNYLRENETPTLRWNEVQTIISACKTTIPTGDEGIFRASINAMSNEELNSLIRKIERL